MVKRSKQRDRGPEAWRVVAINGLGGLEHLWDGFRAALPAVTLLVLDLPGHGHRPPASDYHYDALVKDVLARADGMSPYVPIGWSVGAAVAWLVAAKAPDRISHLVLVEPAAPHQSPFRLGPLPAPVHAHTFASVAKAREALRAVDPTTTDADIESSYRANTAGRWEPRFDPAIYPAIVEDAQTRGEEIRDRLRDVRCPVLFVRGGRSFIRDEQVRELLALTPHGALSTVSGAGHFVVKERPQELASIVAAFLR